MKSSIAWTLVVLMLAGLGSGAWAQQTPVQTPPAGAVPARSGQATTIDCPASAAETAGKPGQAPAATGSATAVGTPQGTGTGSGLATQSSVEARKHAEGEIKKIDSTRTNRIIEVGDVTLEVEPETVILVDCKRASVAELKEGTKVKVAYEVKSNNRNLATVIETQK
jgi:Cu/Ag efflux protein CusF